MPINIPNDLPAKAILNSEQVFVMTEDRSLHQDIRPLNLLFLNLMPKKINTEVQYLRKLSNTPLQVNITFLRVDDHISKNTPQSHMDNFYKDFDEIKDKIFDGMIVTGAALDQTEFKDVTYWLNLKKILLWSTKNVTSTLFSCWGVAAALKAFYDVDIIFRQDKLSGIYEIELSSKIDTLTRGFDDVFKAPISRYCDFPLDVISEKTDINVLASSREVGLYLGVSGNGKQVYVSGHPEYDVDTLDQEYHRDLAANKSPNIPINYYPDNDPNKAPLCSWRGHSSLLFCNWLNYYVYQETPYDPYQSK
ncbi:MAG: homoserine O-succinyltransferase [Succinivibrio sp.]|nr:homoserine O-succinyltransferase [Succinivibrio sp.]MCI6449001.1 homoserine O-succinyltransferase [Succinivibrio sp.]MDD6068439.1 homoserine O-succinyltransferase [Succinivibrio sp.]MDD7287083.1 homoserine O-succinyltransferase [Succinivibrio sp.]MDY3108385.1 homoserine O-succinyltransferase [Succinivibrio sp.]